MVRQWLVSNNTDDEDDDINYCYVGGHDDEVAKEYDKSECDWEQDGCDDDDDDESDGRSFLR